MGGVVAYSAERNICPISPEAFVPLGVFMFREKVEKKKIVAFSGMFLLAVFGQSRSKSNV